jgi:hypothetical protein
LKGAIACYRKAIAADPLYAVAYMGLGLALKSQGDVEGAKAYFEKALECEQLQKLNARLSAILQGDANPRDAAEQLALADLCRQYKKSYAAAARFYADAFAAGAARTAQRGYHAACVAALAAAGQGVDADNLDAKENGRLRQQAFAWLRDNLTQYAKQLEDADAKTHQAVQQTLQHWQKDPDLDSVRGKDALVKLPEAERAAWQQLWAEVDSLLQKTQESTK